MDLLRVAIVEDEEPQRRQLAAWLADEPGTTVVAQLADGETAIRAIDETKPDLVLLDIALPSCSGLEVLRRIHCRPEVVFTTAHRDHAVSAFELGAADYLLKPFGRERLAEAIERVRSRGREPGPASGAAGIVPLAERVYAVRDEGRALDRLFVRDRGAIVPVAVDDIERIDADGDYSAVVTATRRFLVGVPLAALHERIRRADFVRVHRGHVVNLAHVARIVPSEGGRLRVELRTAGKVVASRAGSQALRDLVE
jgi:two-component system LytT family response regulator